MLPKDPLFLIALELDLPSLLAFCKADERVDKLICQKDYIWIYLLKRDFPKVPSKFNKSTYRETYEYLTQMRNLYWGILEDYQKLEEKFSNMNRENLLHKVYMLLIKMNVKENHQFYTVYKFIKNFFGTKTATLFGIAHLLDNADGKLKLRDIPTYSLKDLMVDNGFTL